MEAWQLGVRELQTAFRSAQLSPREALASVLDRIDAVDHMVGAFREVFADVATREAAERTRELANGQDRGPLHGIPVGVKELFDVAGGIGCYGSNVFSERISPTDAEVVRRLRTAGAIVVGTTRSHEFGWGITTQHQDLGSTRNPWATDRVPGGSSGGSAAALAAGMLPLAVGSDTGGSIRIPAAFCGVAGLKPTYGRIPKRGGVALAPSLDHPGPMARRTGDLIDAYEAMAGYDEDDPSTFDAPVRKTDVVGVSLAGVRVGIAPDLHLTPLTDGYALVMELVLGVLEASGAQLVELGFPNAAQIRQAFGAIQMAEAVHYHRTQLGTYPSCANKYGADVRKRLELADEVSLEQYLDAKRSATYTTRVFDVALSTVDVLLTPVSAGGPSSIVKPDSVPFQDGTIPFRDLVMDYTVPQDLTGLPAAVISAGIDGDGIPVGVQLTAGRFREDIALRTAAALETSLDIASTWPPIGSDE